MNSRSELSDPKLAKFLLTRAPGRDGCARWDRAASVRLRAYERRNISKGQKAMALNRDGLFGTVPARRVDGKRPRAA